MCQYTAKSGRITFLTEILQNLPMFYPTRVLYYMASISTVTNILNVITACQHNSYMHFLFPQSRHSPRSWHTTPVSILTGKAVMVYETA